MDRMMFILFSNAIYEKVKAKTERILQTDKGIVFYWQSNKQIGYPFENHLGCWSQRKCR